MDSKRWRRANVLAVDDQPANLIALDAVLSTEFEVIRATSGEQALSILQARDDIDVIVLDVQMPGMDGFETAGRVKELPRCRDIPIVFVTAVYNEDPFVKLGYRAGAVDYFGKPYDPEILRLKVGIYASFHQKADLLKAWAHQVEESEELLRAGRRFSAMLQRQQLGAIVTDAAGRIRHVSTEGVDDLHRLDWSALIAQVLGNGETAHETREIPAAEGSTRTIQCTASPLREMDGTLAGAVLILRDVTESQLVQRDLEQCIRRLASAGATNAS
jgi:response regulator RpfG family c-di-GMP phosphodiesterase